MTTNQQPTVTERKPNPLLKAIYETLGAPPTAPDPQAFINRYRDVLDRYSQAVLTAASKNIQDDLGKSWPSIKACREACEAAEQQLALKAANDAALDSARALAANPLKMPWQVEVERSIEWARRYMTESPLGKEAWLKGFGKPLYDYAQSYARECYRMLAEPKPIDQWRPPQAVVHHYSKYCLDSQLQSAWDKHHLIGGPKPEVDMKRVGKIDDLIKKFAKAKTVTFTPEDDEEEAFAPVDAVTPIDEDDLLEVPMLTDDEIGERLNLEEDRSWETS